PSGGGGGGGADADGTSADRRGGPGGGKGGGNGGGHGDGGGNGGGGDNVLATRFLASDTFSALYQSELERLTDVLFTSGLARDVLDARVATLEAGATDLISAETIASDAESIAEYFTD
ncbi:MAG: hypothetical protein QM622_07645, partial [Microbacterium sp.]